MLEGYFDKDVAKPCEECNILYQIAGLEYANGTNANIDTGMWCVLSSMNELVKC
jgi:hypothetical protein